MRRLILLAIIVIALSNVNAGKWIEINSTENAPAQIQLVNSNIDKTTLHFSIPGFQLNKVITPNGEAFTIDIEEGTPMLYRGAPYLVKLTASIIIPDLAEMEVNITSSKYKDFTNIEIAPSKGNLTRDIDPANVPYQYSKVYQANSFFPGKLTEMRDPYIIRDIRGQTVIVYPFQYNPVSKTLRVYYDINVEVKAVSQNGKNSLIRKSKFSKVNKEFKNIYAHHFINYAEFNQQSKYTPVDDHGNMLIISHGPFMSVMQRFVDWKNTIGQPTEIVDVSTIGGSSAIKTYVANYYNTNGLTFLLLVGDAAQVPSSSTSAGDSDNDYGLIVGNDHYVDIFVGRFSAENILHVITQVDRTITYEMNPPVTTDWFSKCLGIASSQGPGDDNEMDYEHIRNMQQDLTSYTYTACDEMFDGSQGGLDAAGNPTQTMVGNAIDAGRGVLIYTGHGSTSSFSSSGFSSSDVNALTNVNMLPFIWSVACVNGNFVNATCFAEAWMRAVYNEQPTGAIGTLMSTINQSWDPPMDAQDEMVDIMVESYTNNIKRTFGGISFNGCFHMIDQYGGQGESMADTWTLFGDPSVMVRTAMPGNMTVSHLPTTFLGTTQFQVNCNVDDAYVALTIDNQIIGTGYISGGTVTISFPPLSSVDTLTVAVTAYNYIPYIADVPIIAASGPYLAYSSYQVNDSNGNNNGIPEYDENILLDVSLKNLGVDTAYGVSATISSNDTYVSITDSVESWGNIADSATETQINAYEIQIADNIPDQHVVNFSINIADGNSNAWDSYFNIKVNAPSLHIDGCLVDDNTGGNGDGLIDPGETVDLIITTQNNGHCDAVNTIGNLNTVNPFVTINNSTYNLNTINPNGSANAIFNITIDSAITIGSAIDLLYNVNSGQYSDQKVITQSVGIIFEDFETGDFTQFPWVNNSSKPWTITSGKVYEGNFSAQSGDIGGMQQSELSITLTVLADDSISFFKKVSCEQGSTSGSKWDYFEFFIDNQSQGWWDGEIDWSRESFAVKAGVRTFRWVYAKDWWASQGDDCAWIDYVVFPPTFTPGAPLTASVIANSTSICEGSSTQLNALPGGGSGQYDYLWSPTTGLNSPYIPNPIATPNTTINYTVEISDGNDIANASITITVNPKPVTPIITQNGNSLESDAISGNQWYDDNGAIAGDTNQVFYPQASGNYYVIVTSPQGCESFPSNIINYVISGIEEIKESGIMDIYPNPVNDRLNIDFYLQSDSDLKISLLNTLGQEVFLIENTEDHPSGKHSVSINGINLEPGVYFCRFETKDERSIRKVLLSR